MDWDYHMPMVQAGTPGQPKEHGSVVHYHHFRHWRMHGVAYELRDARYNQPNRSMLSTAYGRTREFKDRCEGRRRRHGWTSLDACRLCA